MSIEEDISLKIENNTLKVLNYKKDEWINWFFLDNNKMTNFIEEMNFNGFNFSNLVKNNKYCYNVDLFLFYKKDKKIAIKYTFKILITGEILKTINKITYKYNEKYHECEEI